MLYSNRIGFSEDIDVNFHYWYFLDKGFKFQRYVCNGCHDFKQLHIRDVDYCCIINGIGKSEAVTLLQNADLNEKR